MQRISFHPVRRIGSLATPLLFCLCLSCTTGSALGAGPVRTQPPDPADPAAVVADLFYASPLKTGARLPASAGDEKPVAWREANDTVARVGGWRVYARQAQQPSADKEAAR